MFGEFYSVVAETTVLKLKDGNKMDAKLYEEKRNRLIEILNEILGIEEIRDETRVEIKKIRDKSLENNFEIVLVGEFQGGKSTTFNTICDGREISPRGAMVKTSACKISACNLADPDAEEYAEITWKNERELLLGMIKLIEPYLRKAQPQRFGQATREQMLSHIELSELMMDSNDFTKQEVKPLDIHDPADLELIRKSLSEQWNIYKKDPKNYDQEDLDVLYISSLIVNFVNSPIIAGLLKTNRISIYEVGKLAAFPIDWTARWESRTADAFQPNEIAFVFLASIRCFIHSKNLARLGCVVTDCPGLFASLWDTEVAHKAMLEADAILYLFGGSKTLNQGDIRALNEIRKVKMEYKLVYAINVMGKIQTIRKNVLPENISKLRSFGFDISESDIHLYHALLGLCSRNGVPIKEGTLDKYSLQRFIKVAQTIDEDYGDNAIDVWVELSDEQIRKIDKKESIERLDLDSVKKVAECSGIDDLLNGIEQTVIKKKARSILVYQGGERASAALALLESDLKNKEEVAKQTEEESKKRFDKAREELLRFRQRSSKTILKLEKKTISIPLAENFENVVVLASIPQIAENATEEIKSNFLTYKATIRRLWEQTVGKLKSNKYPSMEDQLKPLITQAIMSTIQPAIEGWLQSIKEGESEIYNETIGASVTSISQELSEDWENIIKAKDNVDYSTLLEGLELPSTTGRIIDDVDILNRLNTANLIAHVDKGSAMHVVGGIAGFFTGTCAFIVAVLILGALPFVPVITPLIALVTALATGLGVSESIKRDGTTKIKNNIEKGLRAGFNEPEARNKLREASLDVVYPLQEVFINHFNDQLEDQSKLFEDRIEENKRIYEKDENIRREIGVKANELRVKKISPMKSKVDEFINDVLSVLGARRVVDQ